MKSSPGTVDFHPVQTLDSTIQKVPIVTNESVSVLNREFHDPLHSICDEPYSKGNNNEKNKDKEEKENDTKMIVETLKNPSQSDDKDEKEGDKDAFKQGFKNQSNDEKETESSVPPPPPPSSALPLTMNVEGKEKDVDISKGNVVTNVVETKESKPAGLVSSSPLAALAALQRAVSGGDLSLLGVEDNKTRVDDKAKPTNQQAGIPPPPPPPPPTSGLSISVPQPSVPSALDVVGPASPLATLLPSTVGINPVTSITTNSSSDSQATAAGVLASVLGTSPVKAAAPASVASSNATSDVASTLVAMTSGSVGVDTKTTEAPKNRTASEDISSAAATLAIINSDVSPDKTKQAADAIKDLAGLTKLTPSTTNTGADAVSALLETVNKTSEQQQQQNLSVSPSGGGNSASPLSALASAVSSPSIDLAVAAAAVAAASPRATGSSEVESLKALGRIASSTTIPIPAPSQLVKQDSSSAIEMLASLNKASGLLSPSTGDDAVTSSLNNILDSAKKSSEAPKEELETVLKQKEEPQKIEQEGGVEGKAKETTPPPAEQRSEPEQSAPTDGAKTEGAQTFGAEKDKDVDSTNAEQNNEKILADNIKALPKGEEEEKKPLETKKPGRGPPPKWTIDVLKEKLQKAKWVTDSLKSWFTPKRLRALRIAQNYELHGGDHVVDDQDMAMYYAVVGSGDKLQLLAKERGIPPAPEKKRGLLDMAGKTDFFQDVVVNKFLEHPENAPRWNSAALAPKRGGANRKRPAAGTSTAFAKKQKQPEGKKAIAQTVQNMAEQQQQNLLQQQLLQEQHYIQQARMQQQSIRLLEQQFIKQDQDLQASIEKYEKADDLPPERKEAMIGELRLQRKQNSLKLLEVQQNLKQILAAQGK